MPTVVGIRVPEELYVVLDAPALLAGMCHPSRSTPWYALQKLGITSIVCLTNDRETYDPKPLAFGCCVALQDLVSGGPPRDPVREEDRVRQAVEVVLAELQNRKGVVVHCQGGRGRTGTVIGCALRALGYDADRVIDYLDRLHKTRGKPDGWPESKWQADLVYRFCG